MEVIKTFFQDYLVRLSLPKLRPTDIAEIIIISIAIYYIIKWVKTSRAWTLMKGLAIILIFWIAASMLNFNVIMWIFVNAVNVGIIAIVILFQPEFRKALDQLGQKNIMTPIFNLSDSKDKSERFSIYTLEELVHATFELAKTKTGALMVIEMEVSLKEYEKTGIAVDALISSQLLVNIFEHNTPLHDGAVTIKGNRITAATCYLPLSDNMSLSKELGTRHRAAVGVSEVTDSFTIIVSEESGKVSIVKNGSLIRNIDRDYLRVKLDEIRRNVMTQQKKRRKLKKKENNNQETPSV